MHVFITDIYNKEMFAEFLALILKATDKDENPFNLEGFLL